MFWPNGNVISRGEESRRRRAALAGHARCRTQPCSWDYHNPLLLAARNGHDAVVQLLLAHEGLNEPKIQNGWGGTPLIVAPEVGHEVVV